MSSRCKRSKQSVFEGEIKEDKFSATKNIKEFSEGFLSEEERNKKRKLREISFLASLRHQW